MGMRADGAAGAAPSEILQRLSCWDWSSAGLPQPALWDPALQAAVRLIDAAGMPMTVLIGSAGLLIPNRATTSLFAEKTGGEFTGRSIFDVLPESAAFYRDVLERVLAGEACGFPEQPMRLVRDGLTVTAWFNLDFVPVIDASGEVLAALGVASEVTHHVSRNRALSDTVGRLRLALDGSGMVGIWTRDAETGRSTCDANVARMFGLPPAECEAGIEDKLFFDAMHEEDRDAVAAALRTAVETGEPYRCRYRVASADGSQRWVIASGKPAFDEDGECRRLLGVIVDITDQMETAAALAESRFQFQTLTEALPQIVWSCDADGRHDYFSARWSEFTGISAEAITEETWKQLVHPQDWPMVSQVWGEAMREGKPYDIDYRFRHHSGEHRWLRVMALPIRDEGGQVARWFGTSTDIHEAYLLAEERAALVREMERLATQDQLTDVLTRRAFIERASTAIARDADAGRPTSLLMLDIDFFKSVNDTYGHPGGDRVLATAAQRMKRSLKKQDLIGRLGGEEFAVLLPGCTPRKARNVAERIRQAVEATPISVTNGSELSLTVSIGATTSISPTHDIDWMLGVADQALYRAKEGGRNRSVFISETARLN